MTTDNIKIPKHVAIIMDGNRRWARERKLPLREGHRKGEKCILPIIDTSIEMGISYLTFWAFSTENWFREKNEVNFLLTFFRYILDSRVDEYHRKNIKLNIIGDLTKFPLDIQRKSINWMEKTKNNKIITVNIALNYGGRDEIVRAVNKWHEELKLRTQNSELNVKLFENFLDTVGQPDPDLLIRTGGEQRLSGFLMWQTEYSELYFTPKYWPDFSQNEFKKAINVYYKRIRRFGR
jgi:undecaprenyl diphosphate synthase